MAESTGLLLVAFTGLFFKREFKEQNVNVPGTTQLLLIVLIMFILILQLADFVDQTIASYHQKKEREEIEKYLENIEWIRVKNVVYSNPTKENRDKGPKSVKPNNQIMPLSANSIFGINLEIEGTINSPLRKMNIKKFSKMMGGGKNDLTKKTKKT